jgi:hypothetical protein
MIHGSSKSVVGMNPGEPERSAASSHWQPSLPSPVRLVDLPTIDSQTGGANGAITVLTGGKVCPFDIKRVYWLHGTYAGEIRGRHAHKTLWQLMIAVSGSFEITISNGGRAQTFLLDKPRRGLFVGPMCWRIIRVKSDSSVLLVAASAPFDESDYIRSYAEFRAFRKTLGSGSHDAHER